MKITTKIIYLDNFLLGILAGVAIGVGGLLNILCLSIGQKILGGFAFSVGLLTVCYFGLHLYTGKVGYFKENKSTFILSLLIMLIGNAIGAIGLGYLLRLTDLKNIDVIYSVAASKACTFNENTFAKIMSLLGLSFLCGNMVFLGVDIYKKNRNWLIKIIGVILCVAFFVISGMEHCIADMFYFAFANEYSKNIGGTIVTIITTIIGNSLGAICLYFVFNNSTIKKLI